MDNNASLVLSLLVTAHIRLSMLPLYSETGSLVAESQRKNFVVVIVPNTGLRSSKRYPEN